LLAVPGYSSQLGSQEEVLGAVAAAEADFTAGFSGNGNTPIILLQHFIK